MYFFKIPRSFTEAGSNACHNLGALFTSCVAPLLLIESVDGHGTCFGGEYMCSCSDTCNDQIICNSYNEMAKTLIETAFEVFNMTLLNSTSTNQSVVFNEQWSSRSRAIVDDMRAGGCSASTHLSPGLLSFVIPVALTLGFCGMTLDRIATRMEAQHRRLSLS